MTVQASPLRFALIFFAVSANFFAIAAMTFASLGVVLPHMIGEFGWTRAEFSGARLPQLMATSITSPLIGWLVFRFGARGVLSGAAVILGLAFSGLSRIQTLPQYYLLIVLLGLAVTGLGDITVGTAVSQWVKRGRGLALGLVYTGSNWGGWLLTRTATW